MVDQDQTAQISLIFDLNHLPFLCPHIERWGEYCVTVVSLSVRLHKPYKTHIWYEGIFSSICICWYQGQGHLQRSRSNIKVTFQRHSCFTNTSCSYMSQFAYLIAKSFIFQLKFRFGHFESMCRGQVGTCPYDEGIKHCRNRRSYQHFLLHGKILKNCGEGKNAGYQHYLLIPQCFLSFSKEI